MVHRYRFIFAVLIATAAAFASSLYGAAILAIDRALTFVGNVLARPFSFAPTFGRLAADGPSLAYDAPAPHSLRHEAGTSRRAAARNV